MKKGKIKLKKSSSAFKKNLEKLEDAGYSYEEACGIILKQLGKGKRDGRRDERVWDKTR